MRSLHFGALLAAWGIFKLIGSANHLILALHHIRDDLGGPVEWDIGFLVFALAQIAVGMAIAGGRHPGAPIPSMPAVR